MSYENDLPFKDSDDVQGHGKGKKDPIQLFKKDKTKGKYSIHENHKTKQKRALDGDNDNSENWKNPPRLIDLKNDLQEAQPSHDYAMGIIAEWLDYYHVRGKAAATIRHNRSTVQPRLIRKQAEWRIPSLIEPFLSTEDIFNVNPVTAEDKAAALQNGLVLNNQFNTKLNKVKFISEYIRTVCMEGTVIVKTGWNYDTEIQEIQKTRYIYREAINSKEEQLVQELIDWHNQDPIMFRQEVEEEVAITVQMTNEQQRYIVAVPKETYTVKEEVTIKNQPTVEVCRNSQVIIDPSCQGDLSKAEFIIYEFQTSISELKKDGRYHNLDALNKPRDLNDLTDQGGIAGMDDVAIVNAANNTIKNYQNRVSINTSNGDEAHWQSNNGFNFRDSARQKMTAYEYWGFWDVDGTGETKPIVVTWIGDTVIRREENPFPDKKLPFVKRTYLEVLHQVYGEPDAALLRENQDTAGAVLRGILDLMGRSANSQRGTSKDLLDFVNKRKFDNMQDYEFNPGKDPRTDIYEHKYPEIPQSALTVLDMQTREAESLTGVKSFNSGINSASLGKVATGVRGALDAASKRELSILRGLADGIIEIGHKIIAMNQEFLNEEEIIRVTHKEFVKVRRDDLAGNFDLSLTISTAEEDNAKAEELAFMLQTTAQSQDPEETRMIRAEIARLRKMPDLARRIEEYTPQPDPLEEQRKLLEIELLKAQIANENAKAIENNANGELDIAKAEVERMKAKLFESERNQKDLDFIEQESGVHQAREIEKQSLQHEHELSKQENDTHTKLAIEQFKADQAKAKEANKPQPKET